ncbi:MAG: glycosyl hydrolase [Paludibacter sp.]|nr:glycosyl hydrolase [Paludibacter sp.]
MLEKKNIIDKCNFNSLLGVRGSFVLFLFLFISTFSFSQPSLYNQFNHPSVEAKPWTFWYWMHGAVSKPGIKADLEAMKQIGLGGAYLMTIRGVDGTYPNAVSQLTPQWWEMVRYSMQEADSLGLKLGMHVSDGFALAGGPWITPKESMQKVVFTDTIIAGGKINNLKIKIPESYQGYYDDIAVYALPVSNASFGKSRDDFSVKSDNPDDSIPFSIPGKDFKASKPCYLEYHYTSPFTLRSIELTPTGNNFESQRLAVSASDDGVNFHLVKLLIPARQGWQNTGFNSTFSVTPTTASYFRLSWTPVGTEPGSEDLDAAKWKPTLKIKEIKLSSTPRINQWEGKAGLVWRVANETSSHEITTSDCTPKDKIINLTSSFKDGYLTCNLPRGTWRILRMGHTSTGQTNATGGEAKGLECDKFSETAVQKQFDNWFGAAFAKTDSALAHRVLKFMHIDSWECGSQNWSSNFATEFKARRGYDLMPYLPLLAGYPIENVQVSEKVLRDVRTTISELVVDVFFKVMQKNAKAYGCETSNECIAPTFVSDGMLHFQIPDRPMGEFWLRSPTHDKPNDMLDAISGAHIYGKNIIQCESFTELRVNWDEDPALLKPVLDRNFALGINKVFFHVFVHNPYMDRAPGVTLDGIGHYFQRDQTWWKSGKAWVDYVTRCQAMLQYGHPVADIAVFTGEEIPRRAILPDRLVPSLPGIFGAERVESERIRLKNEGQPQCEMPAGVHHSANMAEPEKWINPLRGYAYDSFNKDALLRLAEAKNGRLVLPGGASYKVLVLPLSNPMNPDNVPLSAEVKAKINELEKAGVIIPTLPFTANDFSAYGIEMDVIVPEQIAWTHRRGDKADIYFISNQENNTRNFDASFRIVGKTPELWNPVNAEITSPESWKSTSGRTSMKLTLAPYESVFVVFSNKTNQPNVVEQPTNAVTKPFEINGKWNVSFLKNNQTELSNQLFDWSKSANPLIKFYSGTAIYQSGFNWNADSKLNKIYLNLGKVCNLATVRVNGIDCGTAWTTPYQVDITKALKNGLNSLEIEVTNTWANAINGSDKGTPPFPGIWTNGKYRMSEDKLLEAGLIGPLTFITK